MIILFGLDLINGHKILHVDNDSDVHMSCENYEADGYGQDLDLIIISHQFGVSDST